MHLRPRNAQIPLYHSVHILPFSFDMVLFSQCFYQRITLSIHPRLEAACGSRYSDSHVTIVQLGSLAA